jgi:Fe-S-cluster containining protein
MDNNQYYFDAYYEFIKFVDEKISAVEKKHSKNIVCRKGCSCCCVDTSVLPIEFFSIVYALRERKFFPELTSESCAMLKDTLCQIYEFRPLICRSHGLPLAYGEDDDPLSKSVTFCELNFTKNIPQFNSKNILDMDELNIELVRLNEKFTRSYGKDLPERIDLKDIVNYLIS